MLPIKRNQNVHFHLSMNWKTWSWSPMRRKLIGETCQKVDCYHQLHLHLLDEWNSAEPYTKPNCA